MVGDGTAVKQQIHAKVNEIAKSIGNDASKLKNDENIPASGALDSAGLMELMMWYETEFGLEIPEEDLNMANFGNIDAMTEYLARNRK